MAFGPVLPSHGCYSWTVSTAKGNFDLVGLHLHSTSMGDDLAMDGVYYGLRPQGCVVERRAMGRNERLNLGVPEHWRAPAPQLPAAVSTPGNEQLLPDAWRVRDRVPKATERFDRVTCVVDRDAGTMGYVLHGWNRELNGQTRYGDEMDPIKALSGVPKDASLRPWVWVKRGDAVIISSFLKRPFRYPLMSRNGISKALNLDRNVDF